MQSRSPGNRASRCRLFRRATVVAVAGSVAFGWLVSAAAQDVAAGKFAAAIRASGNPCARVIESSSKGDSVWHVRCNAGWYKVTKKGDSTIEVVPLD
jgi:hypothetical protein